MKALFVKELDKVYQQGLPEDDMRERAEEMERMREHVFSEADRNRDGLIDFGEFIDQTKKEEFQRDPGWDTVDTEKVYTHDEYLEFERRRQEEINRMMAEHPVSNFSFVSISFVCDINANVSICRKNIQTISIINRITTSILINNI